MCVPSTRSTAAVLLSSPCGDPSITACILIGRKLNGLAGMASNSLELSGLESSAHVAAPPASTPKLHGARSSRAGRALASKGPPLARRVTSMYVENPASTPPCASPPPCHLDSLALTFTPTTGRAGLDHRYLRVSRPQRRADEARTARGATRAAMRGNRATVPWTTSCTSNSPSCR